jgi:hypothetical protein
MQLLLGRFIHALWSHAFFPIDSLFVVVKSSLSSVVSYDAVVSLTSFVFLVQATRIIEAQKEKPDLVLSQQSFALPNVLSSLIQETMESLKSKLPFIHRSMKLYLANRETEFILFRPVKVTVLNSIKK